MSVHQQRRIGATRFEPHLLKKMIVIHSDECIDCGVCEPECPAKAIFPDTMVGNESWVELNSRYATVWPNITIKRLPLRDGDAFDSVVGKFEQHFSPNAGEGN
jgi:ferredoxin